MAGNPSKDIWKELRKPFPKEVVGQIPKGGIMLDYVGHAAVTDRLLEVDPGWTWEPMATDEHGAPISVNGNLWIRLTVNGVTRIGVGDGKNAKECIGDAIRNAAMRFGVALDLWSKEELESTLDNPELKNEKPSSKPAIGASDLATEIQKRQIKSMLIAMDVRPEDMKSYLVLNYGVDTETLTKAEAAALLKELQ